MTSRGFNSPQYIGCQHHILDRILKHILDYFIPTNSTQPSLNCEFVNEVVKYYNTLQQSYKAETEMDIFTNPGLGDDFKFIFELCVALRFFKENGKYPVIKWRELPSLHNTR